ncbi:Do family serine endopeptidase [Roseibium aggregatum]|uniref:Probable periplasmic serine endoprotease DegP-like n=1 Tax=Roseibium aggregatum TaxID=187304 RepID=A0A926P1M8_9HYPH|nr:Do family serine endopeptidase [Roseibium aggregatum]MBD1545246.1 Do family serine endopeptidase [Roseibium aggregatum]
MQKQSPETGKVISWRARRAGLLAGAMALGVAGVLTAQTAIPNQAALADPVKVESAGPVDFTNVVKAVQPAVVSVRVKEEIQPQMMGFNGNGNSGNFDDFFNSLPKDSPLRRFFKDFGGQGQSEGKTPPRRHQYGMAQGSGFFITEDGYLVTNHHVIDNGTEFTVIDNDGKEYSAKLVGADKRTDLALLKVDSDHKFTYVKFADDAPQVGEWVVAIGNPFGLGGSVTAGIVSARGRDIGAGPYDDFIQIDAPVNRGNSGGPAFNMKGEVIGVNAAIFSPSGGNVGIAFAIPASTASGVIADLEHGGKVVRGWLGVQIQPVTDDIAESLDLKDTHGALVAQVQDDSPAKAAGLQTGDTILSVDGKSIKDPRELSRVIAAYDPDTEVKVSLWRDGQQKDVEVKLGRLSDTASADTPASQVEPSKATLDDLGLALTTAKEAGMDGDGVVIADVNPDGPAADKQLNQGDRILEVAGQKVSTPEDVVAAIDAAKKDGRKAVLFRVERGDNSRFVALPMKKVG